MSFDKVPNVSACVFKEPSAVNFIGINIDKINFKSILEYIDENYKDKLYEKEFKASKEAKLIQRHKLRYAQNVKDSFRVLKNVLIEQNNLLEAQNWHKLELYAKEIEIDTKVEKNNDISISERPKEVKYCEDDYKFSICDFICSFFKMIYNLVGTLLKMLRETVKFVMLAIKYTILICWFCVKKNTHMLFLLLKSFIPLDIDKFIIFWKRHFKICAFRVSKLGKNMRDFTLFLTKFYFKFIATQAIIIQIL